MAGRRGHNEGSIYRTSDGKWRGYVTLGYSAEGKPKKKYVSGPTRAVVSRKVTTILNDLQRGLPVSSSSPTVAEFLNTWLEEVVKRNRPRTYESYGSIVKTQLIPSIGKHRLEKLTALHIQTTLNNAQERSASGRTLLNIRGII